MNEVRSMQPEYMYTKDFSVVRSVNKLQENKQIGNDKKLFFLFQSFLCGTVVSKKSMNGQKAKVVIYQGNAWIADIFYLVDILSHHPNS